MATGPTFEGMCEVDWPPYVMATNEDCELREWLTMPGYGVITSSGEDGDDDDDDDDTTMLTAYVIRKRCKRRCVNIRT